MKRERENKREIWKLEGAGGGEEKNKTFIVSPAGGLWELKQVLYSEILWKLDPAVIPASPETEGIKIGIFPDLVWANLVISSIMFACLHFT